MRMRTLTLDIATSFTRRAPREIQVDDRIVNPSLGTATPVTRVEPAHYGVYVWVEDEHRPRFYSDSGYVNVWRAGDLPDGDPEDRAAIVRHCEDAQARGWWE